MRNRSEYAGGPASDAFLAANRQAIGWTDAAVGLQASPLVADALGQAHLRQTSPLDCAWRRIQLPAEWRG